MPEGAVSGDKGSSDRMPLRYVHRLKLSEDPAFVVRQLLRKKVEETRTPFSGPIYYDDRGWR
jgi:hypothetical protein